MIPIGSTNVPHRGSAIKAFQAVRRLAPFCVPTTKLPVPETVPLAVIPVQVPVSAVANVNVPTAALPPELGPKQVFPLSVTAKGGSLAVIVTRGLAPLDQLPSFTALPSPITP